MRLSHSNGGPTDNIEKWKETVAPSYQEAEKRLDHLMEQGEYQTAIDLCSSLLRKESSNKETRTMLRITRAQCHQALGQSADAIADYKEIIRENPGYLEAYDELGHLYIEKEDVDNALPLFEYTVTVAPERAEGWYGISLCRAVQGNNQEAISTVRRAVELDNKNSKYWFAYGALAQEKQDWATAAEGFKRAFELSPDDIETAKLLAHALINQDKNEEVIRVLTEIISTTKSRNIPSNQLGALYSARAAAFCNTEQIDKAIADSTMAVSLNPNEADFLRVRAQAYYKANRYQETIDDCNSYIEIVNNSLEHEENSLIGARKRLQICKQMLLIASSRVELAKIHNDAPMLELAYEDMDSCLDQLDELGDLPEYEHAMRAALLQEVEGMQKDLESIISDNLEDDEDAADEAREGEELDEPQTKPPHKDKKK